MGNRRKFYRIQCETPICTKMSIVNVNGKEVTTGMGHICVKDIGPGGLKFLSGLDFPVTDKVVIKFIWEIGQEIGEFYGRIVRKEEYKSAIYKYGVQFVNDVAENEIIVRKFDELNNNGALKNYNFCSGGVTECLKMHKFKNNRRSFRRFKLSDKFIVRMDVLSNNSIEQITKKGYITISDISEGGIKFYSCLELLVTNNEQLQAKIYIDNKEIYIRGYVARREEIDEGTYVYGMKFDTSISHNKYICEFLKGVLEFSEAEEMYKRRYFFTKYNEKGLEDENHQWWV